MTKSLNQTQRHTCNGCWKRIMMTTKSKKEKKWWRFWFWIIRSVVTLMWNALRSQRVPPWIALASINFVVALRVTHEQHEDPCRDPARMERWATARIIHKSVPVLEGGAASFRWVEWTEFVQAIDENRFGELARKSPKKEQQQQQHTYWCGCANLSQQEINKHSYEKWILSRIHLLLTLGNSISIWSD